jgi:MSHA biogenesis protein MshK
VAGRLMRHTSILLAMVCVAVASTAVAQALRDPTRPPAASAKAVAGKTEQSGWILQSVLISPERRYAIINGEVVPVGGSIAGAELLAIAEERVTLRTPEGLRILHLFPDVTRLGAADASPGTAKRMQAPEAEKIPKLRDPIPPGLRNENDK